MIGQMIMVGFTGRSERDPGVDRRARPTGQGHRSAAWCSIRRISARATSSARSPRSCAMPSPSLVPFIAVDQEGGLVQRLDAAERPHAIFPRRGSVGAQSELTLGRSRRASLRDMAEELAKAGFNLNFGPVVDLSLNPCNPVIVQRERSYRRRSQDRHHARPRLHHRPSRGRMSSPWPSTFPGHGSSQSRQPQVARRTSPRPGRRSSSSLTARSPRTGCSTR